MTSAGIMATCNSHNGGSSTPPDQSQVTDPLCPNPKKGQGLRPLKPLPLFRILPVLSSSSTTRRPLRPYNNPTIPATGKYKHATPYIRYIYISVSIHSRSLNQYLNNPLYASNPHNGRNREGALVLPTALKERQNAPTFFVVFLYYF